MARSLLIGAVALGAFGWLVGLLFTIRPGKRPTAVPPMFLVAAIALPVLVLAGTLGNLSFLSPAAGFGFALGSGGALAGLVCLRIVRRDAIGEAARRAGPAFAALAVTSAAILWLPQPLKAVSAVAIGACAVSLLLLEGASSQLEAAKVPLFTGLGIAVALSATAALGMFRTSQQVIPLTWESTATSFAGGTPLGLMLAGVAVAGLRLTRRAPTAIFSYGIPLLVIGALAFLLGDRIPRGSMLPILAGIGLGMALLVGWLKAEAGRAGNTGLYETASALVVLGAFAAAFSVLAGYGVGIMMLAAWPLLMQNAEEDQSGTVTRLAVFGILLLLYRLFTQRYQSALASASLTDHFALLGFMVGALLPLLIAAVAGMPGSATGSRLAGVILALIVGSSIPAAMLILWSARIAPALLFGLAFAFAAPGTGPQTRNEAISTGAFTIAVALALVQWAGFALPLSELSRVERMRILALIAGGVFLALLIVQSAGRRWTNFQKRQPVRTLGGQQ